MDGRLAFAVADAIPFVIYMPHKFPQVPYRFIILAEMPPQEIRPLRKQIIVFQANDQVRGFEARLDHVLSRALDYPFVALIDFRDGLCAVFLAPHFRKLHFIVEIVRGKVGYAQFLGKLARQRGFAPRRVSGNNDFLYALLSHLRIIPYQLSRSWPARRSVGYPQIILAMLT